MEASNDQKEKLERKEEENFVKLFHDVLEENREGLSDEEIAFGAEEVKNGFKIKISGSCIKENLDTPEKTCGFFYRYSPLFAGITRKLILIALRDCKELKSCFRSSSLKIVDIGSGAGSALVGLYSALDSYEENIDGEIVRGFPFQSLKVTAMDHTVRWKRFFKAIEEKLKSSEKYGSASRLFEEKKIECFFRCYDVVTKNEKLKEETELKEADIIFVKGFLSILEEDDYRYLVIEAIASGMKSGSLLVVIDSPTYEKYIQDKNLRLVFTTRRYYPTSADRSPHSTTQSTSLVSQDSELTQQTSDDQNFSSQSLLRNSQAHEASCSASDNVWEHYDTRRNANREDYYNFRSLQSKKYDGGLSLKSNQQIFILEKM